MRVISIGPEEPGPTDLKALSMLQLLSICPQSGQIKSDLTASVQRAKLQAVRLSGPGSTNSIG